MSRVKHIISTYIAAAVVTGAVELYAQEAIPMLLPESPSSATAVSNSGKEATGAAVSDSAALQANAAQNVAAIDPAAATPTAADELARAGQYAEATQAYEAILSRGEESATIYYNLGYCYFKQGSLGRSILNFERARRLEPSDEDTKENLRQAYALTDKMLVVEPNPIAKAWTAFRESLNSDAWATLFVALFFGAIVGLGCFLFLSSVSARKAGFFASIALVVLAACALTLSLQMRAEQLNSDQAIIMSSSVNLTTSPDKNGGQMAVLHEGTHVVILEELGEWIEVRLDDGNVGWLRSEEVERI